VTDETVRLLRERTGLVPEVGVVLGSGLGGFAGTLAGAAAVPYSEIPGWPVPSVAGHEGVLVAGRAGGVAVAVLCGRAHLYEGHAAARVAWPVRVLGRWGAGILVVTNAAGGIDPALGPGRLVLISDHINLQGATPFDDDSTESFGPRFVDMTGAYSARLREIARRTASEIGIALGEGVYAAVPGPAYETPAEVRYLRTIGADLVGMSTVQEVLAARQMGLEVLGISCVTNRAAGLAAGPLSHEEVLAAGRLVGGTLAALLAAAVPRLVPRGE
jgi:purine-nucleoside phosphorylase